MKEKIKTVYYCEYCYPKKKYFMKDACERHEKRCTGNLGRVCNMGEDHVTPNYRELIDMFNGKFVIHEYEHGDDFRTYSTGYSNVSEYPDIEEIKKACDYCPACTLTVIRKLKFPTMFDIDYEQMKQEWWAEHGHTHEVQDYVY